MDVIHLDRPAPGVHEPMEGAGIRGVDAPPERRPGVPMASEPRPYPGASWRVPARQPHRRTHLHRRGLDRLTPVYGNAVPPRGISGLLRRVAYRIPEHRARHWMLLLGADRVDVLEGRLGETLARPIRHAGLEGLGRLVERHATAILAAAMAGLVIARIRR